MSVAWPGPAFDGLDQDEREPLPAWLVASSAVIGAVLVGLASGYGSGAAVGAALLVAGALWLAVRPTVCLMILVGAAAPLSGLRRGFPVPQLRAGEAAMLAAGGILVVLGRRSIHAKWAILEWLFFGYVAATIGIGFYALRQSGESASADSFGILLVPVFHLFLYLAVRVAAGRPGMRERGIRVLMLSSIPVSIISILQYFDIAGMKNRLSEYTDLGQFSTNVEQGYVARATGPFAHWHLLAGFLFPILLVAVAIALDKAWHIISPTALGVVATFGGIAMVLTLTYTAFVGLLVGTLLVGAWARKATVMAMVLMLVTVVAGFAFSEQLAGRFSDQFSGVESAGGNRFIPSTLNFRFSVWTEQFLPVILEKPTVGYGPTTPKDVTWEFTESVYITMLLRGGLILLAIFLAYWFALLARSWATRNDADPAVRIPARALTASVIVLIPMNAVFPYYTSPGLPHVLAVLAGLAFAPTHERLTKAPAERRASSSQPASALP